MRRKLLEFLACIRCGGGLRSCPEPSVDEDLLSGTLHCDSCRLAFPVRGGIPRFVDDDNYARSFGIQWNRFRREQLDSLNGLTLSQDRFISETTYTPTELDGLAVLDAGCGAGRFLDVVSKSNATVVGIDITNAVDAARENLINRPNVHLVQASLDELPFRSGSFDLCYCIGVIQHTPNPDRTIMCLPRVLMPGGQLALTVYEHSGWWTRLNAKYLVRKLLRRVPRPALMRGLVWTMPILFAITDILFRLPVLGRVAAFAIPVANYVHEPQLSLRSRYRWALMDTFDMLAPAYDSPQTLADVTASLEAAGMIEIRRLPARGLCVLSRKGAQPAGALSSFSWSSDPGQTQSTG